jgi:hypothetical protein
VTKPPGGRALLANLWDLSADIQRERIAISDLPNVLGDRATGALTFVFAFPNVLPALAISLMALGVLERDGLWVLSGLTVSVAAVFVVYGVVFAIVEAAWYFFNQVL